MSKKSTRRTPEQRIERRIKRNAIGAGVHRYLTPAQAASEEFNPTVVSETERPKLVIDIPIDDVTDPAQVQAAIDKAFSEGGIK